MIDNTSFTCSAGTVRVAWAENRCSLCSFSTKSYVTLQASQVALDLFGIFYLNYLIPASFWACLTVPLLGCTRLAPINSPKQHLKNYALSAQWKKKKKAVSSEVFRRAWLVLCRCSDWLNARSCWCHRFWSNIGFILTFARLDKVSLENYFKRKMYRQIKCTPDSVLAVR